MLARVNEVIAELKANPPPVPVGDIAEAIQFLEWLDADNFTLLGVQEYAVAARPRSAAGARTAGSACCAQHDLQILRRGGEVVTVTPEIRRSSTSRSADRHQGQRQVARASPRPWTTSASSASTPTASSTGELRIVGLFTSRRLHAPAAHDPVSAAQGRRRRARAPASIRTAIPARRWSTSGDLSARRAVPDRRGHALSHRARHPAARGAAARARVGAPRPLRPLRLGAGLRAARPLRHARARRRSANISPGSSMGASAPSIRISRTARWCACISSSAAMPAKRRIPIARRWKRRSPRSSAPGRTRCREALQRAFRRAVPRAMFERYRDAFSDGYREAYSPSEAVADIRVIEALSADRPLAVDFYHQVWDEQDRRRPRSVEPRPADPAVRARAGAGEHGLPRRRRAHLSASMPAGRQRDVWLHDMALECVAGDGAVDLDARQQRARSAVHRGHARLCRERRLQRADAGGRADVARRRAAAHRSRASCARSACRIRRTTCGRRCASMPALAAQARRAVPHRASIRARQARWSSARSARRRSLAEIEAALEAVESLDEDRILRHFVNAVQAAVRTNYYQIDNDGQPKPQIAIKFESRKIDGLPAPRPLYEIFVYSPRVEGVHLRFGKVARGGIRWSDRPQDFRTEILGPGEGAAGQERGDRAGRRQGRLRAEAAAASAARARRCRPKASPPTSCSSRRLLDITDNLDRKAAWCRPTTWCATTATIPISSSPPTRAPRPSPTSPTRSPSEHGFWLGDAFASGGSAGYDHKKMGITARGAWESVKRHFREMDVDIQRRRSPWSASATCRATCSATACCCREHDQAASPRSTIATSSSIPIPIRRAASPSASGCSSCRARAGRTTTRR